jgi:hypothetical protein
MAFISRSNCEQELSGIKLNRSSKSSLGSTGDVGGVLKGLDWIDERDGVDEPLTEFDWTGACDSLTDPDESGLLSTGDMGGVCDVWESCWNMFIDTASPPNEPELLKFEFTMLASSVYGLDAVSKLFSILVH